jgi:hypothetical protein
MIALYLALVLVGIIVGSLIGFAAPESLFTDSREDALEWAAECNAEIDVDFAFQSMMNRILTPKSVIIDWRTINTPSLSRGAVELLEDWSNALACSMDILALARTGDNTCETRQIEAPTREVLAPDLNMTSKRKPSRKAVRRAGKVRVSCNY